MDKISRILPGSPRVTQADLRGSGVARPGSPSFGRPVGVSALAQRTTEPNLSGRASEELSELTAKREPNRRGTDEKADIVERMASNFFMKKPSPVEAPEQNDAMTDILEKFHAQEDSDLNPMTGRPPMETAGDDAPIIGGNLNIVA